MKFCRNPLLFGKKIEAPTMDTVKNTLALWNCDLDDALRYGGELTRAAIGAMNFRGDRNYLVVDTKIHMLMPGFMPAIPGWHTDGVPRGQAGDPAAKEPPNIALQENSPMRPPRYHLLVTGAGCLTEFIKNEIEVSVPTAPTPDLYRLMTKEVNGLVREGKAEVSSAPSCQVIEWDWWNIHQGIVAKAHEWRFLIRVTETDHFQPQTDLRKIIRNQQQVYVPAEFGW